MFVYKYFIYKFTIEKTIIKGHQNRELYGSTKYYKQNIINIIKSNL